MKPLILFLLSICFCQGFAQSFRVEATVPIVDHDGFYRILLAPEISAHLNEELSDVRIYDDDKREVPYLLQREQAAYYANRFVEYEIVEKKYTAGCCTFLMLRNARKTPINNIQLVIKNAEASRKASLLGSDDKQTWFSVRDNFNLSAPKNSVGTQALEILGFPWSNYEFYLLEISDSAVAPLNIVRAGYNESEFANGNFTALPAKITVADSVAQKMTYVRLRLDTLHFLDRIEVRVEGTKYYRRNATLYEKATRKSRNETIEYLRAIQHFELTSGRTAVVELNNVRAREVLMEIENHDNPPLTISDVKIFQLNRYLTTYLQKDVAYTIKLGQAKLGSPVYDLAYFKDSIPKQIPVLRPAALKVAQQLSGSPGDVFFTSKTIIWIAIFAVAVVLVFMSIRLVREASQQEEKK